ncbi:MAG: hypothetical protein JO015_01060 [Verrucomicrobia bacterium]|nr:hypothetical protein [Verrucomicrobiota bacterium]
MITTKADAAMPRSRNYTCLVLASLALLAPSYADDLSNEALAKRVQELEKRLSAIESIPQVAAMLKLREEVNALPSPTPNPTPQENAPLMISDWQYQFKDGEYEWDKRHLIRYALTNRTDHAIKLVDGSLTFRDLLGEQIFVRLDQDVFYPPHDTVPTQGAWKINPLNPEEMRLQRMNHDNVKAEVLIRRVVFDDNTVWSATP